ncbi:hypothetical protein GOBAR_DD27880 [Gossypium barbadense]|nr:hypothetical protein GOBAR_DD27880 [Gossypium barbadense]
MYAKRISEVDYTVRRNECLRLVLSRGWIRFIVQKKLRVGDRITMYKDEDGSSHYMVEVEEPSAMNQHGTLPNSLASCFIRHEPDRTTVEAGAHHQPDIAVINMFANPCQWPSIEMFGTNINDKRAHFSLVP